MMQPKLQRSQLKEYGSFLRTSGATYPSVPNGSSAASFGAIIFASPKSANFGTLYSVLSDIITFSNLRSLWTIP